DVLLDWAMLPHQHHLVFCRPIGECFPIVLNAGSELPPGHSFPPDCQTMVSPPLWEHLGQGRRRFGYRPFDPPTVSLRQTYNRKLLLGNAVVLQPHPGLRSPLPAFPISIPGLCNNEPRCLSLYPRTFVDSG